MAVADRTGADTGRAGTGRSRSLTRSECATIGAHWGEVVEHLTPPGVAWEWGRSGLSERLKHYLRHHGLIVRDADDPDRWQTTEGLWCHVIERAGDDEPVGTAAVGQEKLPGVTAGTGRSRSVAATSARPPHPETRQVTLTGEPADPPGIVNTDEIRARTRLKDPARPSDRERAAEHPSQMKLNDYLDRQVIDASKLSDPQTRRSWLLG